MIEQLICNGIINTQDIDQLAHACEDLDTRLLFIDVSFVLPHSGIDIYQNFKDAHIPDALLMDITQICDTDCDLPHMLPSSDIFGQKISELGIRNSDVLVLYGQQGMIIGPARGWWMFRGFGHEHVAVLNGGLPEWIKRGKPTQTGQIEQRMTTSYNAAPFNANMVCKMQNVIDASDNTNPIIIDARPADRFNGKLPEPRANMRSGHIPNSVNLPCSSLVDKDGLFKSKDELEILFQTMMKAPKIITTCGSGVTACALSLALYHIGHKNVSVYDGSWSEWGHSKSHTHVMSNS